MEEIAAAAPGATRFFQLYAQVDPGRTRSLVERAAAAGYGAIVLTVDLPELGYRDRDRRSGFSLDVPHGNFRDGAEPTHGSHASDAEDGTGADLARMSKPSTSGSRRTSPGTRSRRSARGRRCRSS